MATRVQINQPHKHAYETYDVVAQYDIGWWQQQSFVECGEPVVPPTLSGITVNELELQSKESAGGLVLPTDGLVEIGIGFDNAHEHDFLEPPDGLEVVLENVNLYGDLDECYEGHADCDCENFQYYLTSGYNGAIVINGDGELLWKGRTRGVSSSSWDTAINRWHHHAFYQYNKITDRDGHTFSVCPLGHTGCLITKVFESKDIAGTNILDYEGKSGVADFGGADVYNGVGTAFTTEFAAGDWIAPYTYRTRWWEWRQISSIISDTQLEVTGTFPLSISAKRPYKWTGAFYYLTDNSEKREINE